MALQIEQVSPTQIWIHDGATSIMEIDTTNGVRINSTFKIGTDLISPSASELAAIDGLTSTSAELNLLDGSVAGTAVASKALAIGADKNVDTLAIADSGLKLGSGAGTAVTKTAAQINALVGGVAGSYRLARGVHTTVSATDTVATGLTTVVSAVASFETDPADANFLVNAFVGDQAGTPAAGSIIIKTWKHDGTDPTPVAASAFTKLVSWIAIGT